MRCLIAFVLMAAVCACSPREEATSHEAEPLAGWSDTPAKQRILQFIEGVTDPAHRWFTPPERRIAVFDMDGTLIVERPDYIEVLIAMETLASNVERHPELAEREPYRAVVEGDTDYIRGHGAEIVTTAAEGLSLERFRQQVRNFMDRQAHPTLARPYSALFYRPMLELVLLLENHDFRVYIVSQSQQEYIRAFALTCLGVEPSSVIGSSYRFQWDDDEEAFVRSSALWEPYNVGMGKVSRIRERSGGLPILAIGNSTGDRAVMESTHRHRPNLVVLLDHDDPEREFEYHNQTMLELAADNDWLVASMKRDFATLYNDHCALPVEPEG